MRHLVTDYDTDRTVVHGIVSFRIEERRLQDGCRETDFVCRRVIISIYGLRAHPPTGSIDRFVYVRQHIIVFEDIGATYIRPVRIVFDF